jgi:hypothetical protein
LLHAALAIQPRPTSENTPSTHSGEYGQEEGPGFKEPQPFFA